MEGYYVCIGFRLFELIGERIGMYILTFKTKPLKVNSINRFNKGYQCIYLKYNSARTRI